MTEDVPPVAETPGVNAQNRKVMNCRWCGIPILWDKNAYVATEIETGKKHECPSKPPPSVRPGKVCSCGRETYPVKHCVGCRRPVNMCACQMK